MAELNLEYYTAKDHYSDGDIEEKLLEMAQTGKSFQDLPKEEVSFPMIYHFSEIRENILNWYPFTKEDSILEIGAGCGAITGMLCRRAGHVTAVELSKRRADINYARHKEYENLTIMVGNLNDMSFDRKFDYVVVNGVLEYAMSFTEGETPYETFLRNMGTYLNPTGRLLIAIENRLGLKYFAGAPEDHTDLYFYGIDGYPNNRSVRTFSKKELGELLERSGFPFMRFYYPYPDYKFPTEIFTDESLYTYSYGKGYPVYTDKTLNLFAEESGVSAFTKEKILDKFVNSFLVDAGTVAGKESSETLYVKMNQARKEEFRLLTKIVREGDRLTAVKETMTPKALPFLQRLQVLGNCKAAGGNTSYENLPCTLNGNSISYPVLKGKTMHQQIEELSEQGEIEKVKDLLRDFYENFFADRRKMDYRTPEFIQVFGDYPGKEEYECVSPANIDLICSNIFAEEEKNQVIDYEWTFDFAVPAAFIMWRMVHELYTRINALAQRCQEYQMLEALGIEFSDDEIFMHWTMHFVYEYVGSDSLGIYAKPKTDIPFYEILEDNKEKKLQHTKLYYDFGKGFDEDHAIGKELVLENRRFHVEYEIPEEEGIKTLRWNPSKGQFAKVQIDRLDCGCSAWLEPFGEHFSIDKDTTAFFTTDGYFEIKVLHPEQVRKVSIDGRIEYMDLKDVETYLEEKAQRKRKKEQEKAQKTLEEARKAQREADRAAQMAQLAQMEAEKNKGVKGFLKKVLHIQQEQAPVPVPVQEEVLPTPTCMGSIDFFHYENTTLNVIGWAYDPTCEMGKPKIVFYHGAEKVYETKGILIHRPDVAQVTGIPQTESAGFSFLANVLSPTELSIFREYGNGKVYGRFFLGKIPAHPGQKKLMVMPVEDSKSIGNIGHFRQWHVRNVRREYPQAIYQQMVDIIVPVYNGLEYFDALFSGIEKTKVPYRLIIVNDKSPDPAVGEYLENYASSRENVVLLNNEKNLGFLPSVNRALQMAEHHVALVNTDVEVPQDWLERLMMPIWAKEKIASSTPFTTCGTICSFPDFCRDNKLFEDMPLWEIDDAFRMIKPQYPSMPTGVGFCMGMNIHAIREIGVFDEESFGKGYGEENDWCQRAVEAGYENVHVDNLFVYHKHGGSFPSEEKQRLLKEHRDALVRKHPEYEKDTAAYCRRDPLRTVRLYTEMKLLDRKLDVHTILAFDHDLGGGATAYLVEKRKLALRQGYRFLTLRYNVVQNKYYLNYRYKKYEMEFSADDLEAILSEILRVDEIWINELVTYQNFYKTLDRILELKEEHGAKLKMLLHDFFALCPAVNLVNAEGKYCGAASCEVCDKCIPDNRSNACTEYESGTLWRKNFRRFLRRCDEIVAFSDDSAQLFKKAYPDVYNLHVTPHTPHYLPPLNKQQKTTETFNIGLIGVLCYKKGLEVVKGLSEYIEEHGLNIRLKLLGTSDEKIEGNVFTETGRYTREQLPRLTMEQDIDMFLIPSMWPETFSYTTSEVISMNMPIATLPVGAPVERVKRFEKGLILTGAEPETILREMTEFWKKIGGADMPVCKEKILFAGEEISFASRYRVEHFQEQMLLRGFPSDFIQMEDAEETEVESYKALVLYRCSRYPQVKKLVDRAKAAGLPVYYNIDDLIFDYDRISGLHFLKGEEYKDFKETTEKIHKCMELCDGYFTSTNTLAEEIRKEYPGKPVIIDRNCASMEMEVLSYDAAEGAEKDENKIYIGYLSGSRTHDKDFFQAEEALLEVMERHPQVYLKLVGVLSEEGMEKVQNRIEKLPFMDWRQLPAAIAGLDINLMPLEDSVFHCCKSENKWMEAALVKVPSVMSRNQEIAAVVENGKTGWMCSTKEEWVDALEKLVTDAQARKEMGEAAHQVVMERYLTRNTGKDAMEELCYGKGTV